MATDNTTFIRLRTFDDNLKHSLSFAERKKSEPKFLNRFLYRVKKYVQSLKSNNPNITKQEVEEILLNDIEELSAASYCGAKISQNYMKYICYESFSSSPEKLDSILAFLNENHLTFSDIEKMNRSTYHLTQIYYAAQLQKDFNESDSNCNIHQFVKKQKDNLEPTLKEDIINSISAITTQLDKMGLLSTYLEINNKKLSFLRFPEYAQCITTDNNNSAQLLNLLNKENLQKNYSPSDLLTLYSFWVNRYYKELDTYLEAMFVVHDFDLIPTMLDDTFKSLPKEQLKKSLVKMNLFYDPTRFYLEMQKAERLSENEETEFDISDNIYSFSDKPFLHFIKEEFNPKYKEFFDSYLPESKNDLEKDAKTYFNLYNPIFATYRLKDSTILYLLLGLVETNNYKNAGLIPSSIEGNQATFPNFIGIGIDNGMTDTFLLHINKNTLTDFLSQYMADENCLLPLYSGKVDFTRGTYSIPVLAPMSDEQKKLLDMPPPSANIPYIKHLRNVKDYKSINLPKRYVNLSTNEIITGIYHSNIESSER